MLTNGAVVPFPSVSPLLLWSVWPTLLQCCGVVYPFPSNVAVFWSIPLQRCGFCSIPHAVLRCFVHSPRMLRCFGTIPLQCCGVLGPFPSNVAVFFVHSPQVLRFFCPFPSNVAVFWSIPLKCCGFLVPFPSSVAVFFVHSPPVLRFFLAIPLQCCGFFYPFPSSVAVSLSIPFNGPWCL